MQSTETNSTIETNTAPRRAAILGWTICIIGAIFYTYEYLLRIEPSVMVPQLMHTFAIDAGTLGFLVSFYYLVYTPMQAFVGVITDVYGPRRVLTIALSICVIGSFLFSNSDSIYLAGFGRALIGFGSAFAFVGIMKLAAVWLPANRFAFFAGLATSLGMIGAMYGDVQMAYLVHHVGWRETLEYGTLFGLVLIPLIWFVVRDRPKYKVSDVVEEKLTFKQTFKGLFECVRNPQMWIAGFIGTALYLSLSVFAELWGDQYLKNTYNLTATQSALANSMVFFGWLIGSPIVGFLSDHFKMRRFPMTLGCIFSTIIVAAILYLPTMPLYVVYGLLVVFGICCSAEIICFAVGRENTRAGLSGTAVAFINMLVMLSGLIFQPLVGRLLDLHWSGLMQNGLRVYTSSDYVFALSIIPIALIIAAILTFFLNETHAGGPKPRT